MTTITTSCLFIIIAAGDGLDQGCSLFWQSLVGGTGSQPPGWKGWHLQIRRSASQEPRTAPKRSIAWRPYSEQEGWKRQESGSHGEIQVW